MRRVIRNGVLIIASCFLTGAIGAEEDYQLDWSATFELRFKDFESPVNDDDVTGFFDQYEFTANKNVDPTIEFALSGFDLDLFAGEETQTPRLQFRLRSPSSDLNLSGKTFASGEYLLNQRANLYARSRGVLLDLDYRRFRTEDLRLFNDGGWANDLSSPDDRYYIRRNRIGGELRIRPDDFLTGPRSQLGNFLSEIALRGAYEERDGNRQTRELFLVSLTSDRHQDVTNGGGGFVLKPGGLMTLAFDINYQRFREKAAPDLRGLNPAGQTTAFVPDTDRVTTSVRMNSRLGKRAVVHGGFQISSLEKVGTRTPRELSQGLDDNKLLYYSGNLAGDVSLFDDVSLNAFFKFDSRRNRIDTALGLFDPTDGTQEGPLLKRIRRSVAGAEAVYRLAPMNRVAIGVRGEWTDRQLDFPSACAGPPGVIEAICSAYTTLDDGSQFYRIYLRSSLRPLSGLQLSGEFGYEHSPETGYIRELEDRGYGKLRASYTFPIRRPLTFSFLGRGEIGNNDNFQQRGTSGTLADRDFDRNSFSLVGTLSGSPRDDLTFFSSIHYQHDTQDFDLIASTRARPDFATGVGDFLPPSDALDYRADTTTLILGATVQITDDTDASASYSFTRSHWRIQSDSLITETIDGLSRVKSDLHRTDFEIRHWLRPGLRLSAGYRFAKYRDRSPTSRGIAVVTPFDLSTREHTVTLGVTVNSDAFD